ncbi:MAG: 50S ribosomal protein L10 [candidate division WOR-3 bacterium]|nr:50S ribosomal protein L10 [candidate division WOR-3 bacterium]MCX7757141.1 50S ribosomal protein L10 [candidate division WOR-3 bacterium]MDW7987765.1 50S ribosomal protein L10 [candidate division WOR-3 bacterium]
MVANEKIVIVDNLVSILESAKAIYFTDLSKINANEISQLRGLCRARNVKIKVVKNRLCQLALEKINIKEADQFLVGPTALFVAYDDPLVPIRLIKDFRQKNPQLQFKGAFIEGLIFSANQFEYLSKIPSKIELYGHLLSVLQQSIVVFVYSLESLLGQLVMGLEEIKAKKESQKEI